MLKKCAKYVLWKTGYQICRRKKAQDQWPNQSEGLIDFETILIFTPPNSGSTAISEYLLTSSRVASFAPRSEMQWLIPGLCGDDRWWPEKAINYKSVVGTLNSAAKSVVSKNKNFNLFVEKSPPNMVRSEGLLKLFPKKRILINNRDPYANIASQLKRYPRAHFADMERVEIVKYLAKIWLYRSEFLIKIAEKYNTPTISYEAFCENPGKLLSLIDLPELDVAAEAQVKVKDYSLQKIRNMNTQQIEKLSDSEVELISSTLSKRKELLDEFAYRIY